MKMNNLKEKCYHPEKEIKIIKFYRKNYPFGKNSGLKKYSVRMCKEICERCDKELNRWKPFQ